MHSGNLTISRSHIAIENRTLPHNNYGLLSEKHQLKSVGAKSFWRSVPSMFQKITAFFFLWTFRALSSLMWKYFASISSGLDGQFILHQRKVYSPLSHVCRDLTRCRGCLKEIYWTSSGWRRMTGGGAQHLLMSSMKLHKHQEHRKLRSHWNHFTSNIRIKISSCRLFYAMNCDIVPRI